MAMPHQVGAEAVETKGFWAAHRWLLLRRLSQVTVLLLFLAGPLWELWIVKGNMASSLTLDFLPLTDPMILLQSLLGGNLPTSSAWIGAVIVLLFYMLVGGRVYCSWVCPVNMITDFANWLRRKLGLQTRSKLPRSSRYWMLGLVLVLPLMTGMIVWELVNPVSLTFRGIIFGFGLAWIALVALFLFDLAICQDGWCGRLCPVGAFYGLLGRWSLIRVRADKREQCDDCMDCFIVCPEPQVIKPALKGAAQGKSPVILSHECTNCGRCIDVCAEDVFQFGKRFANSKQTTKPSAQAISAEPDSMVS